MMTTKVSMQMAHW